MCVVILRTVVSDFISMICIILPIYFWAMTDVATGKPA